MICAIHLTRRALFCLTTGSQEFIVFLLPRWFINSYRLHAPYAQSHSPKHPPVSSLHNLLTDQWECPVNKTAFVTPLCGASRLMGRAPLGNTVTGHQQADFQVCKPQTTINHHRSKHTEQSQLWFQQRRPSCTHTRYKRSSTHSEKELPCPPSTLSSTGTGNITHPRAEGLTTEVWKTHTCERVIFTHASVMQFPLDTRSSHISIKLIIYIRCTVPQKTRFLSLQPQ